MGQTEQAREALDRIRDDFIEPCGMDSPEIASLKRDIETIRQALSVPEGYRQVPKEPTEAMVDAGVQASEHQSVSRIYGAMIAAAPDPED